MTRDHRIQRRWTMGRAWLCAAMGLATTLSLQTYAAGDVEFAITGRTTEVGVPIKVIVTVRDAEESGEPQLPANTPTFSMRVLPGRNRSESISFVNGRQSRSVTETYQVEVTPLLAGHFPLPTIAVVVDGTEFSTPPADIVVNPGTPVEDLATAVVESPRPAVWLGEASELELVLTLRATPIPESGRVLSSADMWRSIELQGSEWGPFTDSMTRLLQSNRMPPGRQVSTAAGVDYVYRIPVEFYADKAGVPDLSAVRIRVNYPLEVGVERDFFGQHLAVTKKRPITLEPTVAGLEVRALPAEGRPASFTGAVGHFDVKASARPTTAVVGDPITLTFVVRDRGGTAELQSVQPPNLSATPGLEQDFAIPDATAGGIIQDSVKVFTQTLRPLHEDVNLIPPIEFSWFNPRTSQYESTTTAPLPISVRPAERMARSAIEGRQIGSGSDPAIADAVPESTGRDTRHDWRIEPLLGTSSPLARWTIALAIGAPPAVFAALALVVASRRRAAANPLAGRRRHALRVARAQLGRGDPERAITGLVEDRTGAIAGTMTRRDVVRALSTKGHADVTGRADSILMECEAARYAQRSPPTDILQRTSGLLAPIARALPLVALVACVTMAIPAGPAFAADELPPPLQTGTAALAIQSAHESYDRGLSLLPTSPEAARLAFANAAREYGSVIEAGARNPGAYLDLGNALLAAGDGARARAAYLAGQQLDPGHLQIRQALRTAAEVPLSTPDRLVEDARTWWQSVPTTIRWTIAWASWLAVWLALAVGVLLQWPPRVPWRLLVSVSAALAIASGVSVLVDRSTLPPTGVAVVLVDGAVLRTGTGESFGKVPGPGVSAGTIVNVIEDRPAWSLVQVSGGREGWLPASTLVRPGPR